MSVTLSSRFSVLCILDLYFLTGNEDLPLFYAVLVLPFFFFFFPFIFISWRLITLQYCSGFCGMFRENSIKTCILSRVKQITSPGWMHETSAQAWCTGKTQRIWVEREVGGGIGMGNTCKSKADSCQCSPSILVGTMAELSVKKRVEHEAGSPMFSLLLEVPTTG